MRRIASPLPTRPRLLSGILLAAFVSACGGGDGGQGPTVTSVSSVLLTPTTLSLRVGGSGALSAVALDGSGNQLPGRTIAWTSSNSAVAAVGPGGVVTAMAPGAAQITATVEGRAASAQVTVAPAVGRVQVTAPPTIDLGEAVSFTAQVFDTQNGVIPNATVIWATSNEAIASVSAAGLVTGRSPGSVMITATSENIPGSVNVVVRFAGGGSLTVTDVTPATLTPGATATITGTGFSGEAGQNVVMLGGVPAAVTAATATQLTITVPTGLPCRASGAVELQVSSPLGLATRQQAIQSSVARTLAVGEMAYVAQVGQFECMELVNGGRYVVSVANSASSPNARESFLLRGVAPAPAAATLAAREAPRSSPVLAARPLARGPTIAAARQGARGRDDWRREHRAAEAMIRANDRQLLRTLGAPRRYRAATRATPGSLAATAQAGVKLTVGAKDTLKVMSLTQGCGSFTRVPARVVYVGPKAVVLEADDSPLAGTMDDDYKELAQEFEQSMLPILTTNFGNPLAYDASTDANGRVIMFFTNKVNAVPGLLGFVTLCDFFPPTLAGASASNLAEIFYARVPTQSTGNGTSLNERSVWKWRMRATIIHEVKHIVSYAELMETPILGIDEDSWLEEGTAQIAEEIYGRGFWNTSWKGNATYAETMHCSLTLNPAIFPECAPALAANWPYAIGDHFLFLYDYALNHEGLSFLSSGSEASHIYGSAWLFLRWAIDHFATSESAFLRDLVTSYQERGVRNVELRTGKSIGELAALFALAMATDDRAGFTAPAGATYTIPSWSLAGIWSGIAEDLGNNGYSNAQPYAVRSGTLPAYSSGAVFVSGASAAVFDLSDVAPRGLLELRTSGDTPLSRATRLRMAIVRVQ